MDFLIISAVYTLLFIAFVIVMLPIYFLIAFVVMWILKDV